MLKKSTKKSNNVTVGFNFLLDKRTHRDGLMQTRITKGLNVRGSSINGGCPFLSGKGYNAYPEPVGGVKEAKRSASFGDHFSQAKLFYDSMTPVEQAHIQSAFVFELSKLFDPKIQQRVVDLLNNVDAGLAEAIAHRIGAMPPAKATAKIVSPGVATSNNLSIIKSQKYDSIAGRMVAILLMPGYDSSVHELVYAIKAAGAVPCVVSATPAPVPDASGSAKITPSFTFFASSSTQFDAFFIPGGRKHVDALLGDATALVQIAEGFKHLKAICAVNEGVEVLARLGLQVGKAATDGQVVEGFGVVTAIGVGTGVGGKIGQAVGAAVGAAS
ncbi:hypothetical protein HDU87_004256 [Geranomyces variabilis]|uniref:catalase n=1 Tax=Geranomyces variabilis TaxID=109894 RepID=A0AAD5XM29_9FUNG|nr:hypothetical protein HDU87_004256 [Geranomyces variabilis]